MAGWDRGGSLLPVEREVTLLFDTWSDLARGVVADTCAYVAAMVLPRTATSRWASVHSTRVERLVTSSPTLLDRHGVVTEAMWRERVTPDLGR